MPLVFWIILLPQATSSVAYNGALFLVRIISSTSIYFFKLNNRNNRKRCEMYSKLIQSVFIFNFKHISHLFLVFLLLILNKWMFAGSLIFVSEISESGGGKFWFLLGFCIMILLMILFSFSDFQFLKIIMAVFIFYFFGFPAFLYCPAAQYRIIPKSESKNNKKKS